jgi:hypothetical protein
VLNLLTKYLLQYRQVSIPSVGTIRLVQGPAQLVVADKVLLPPSFAVEVSEADSVPDHQLVFLSAALREEKEAVLQSLHEVGNRIGQQVSGEGFHWKGIGLIQRNPRPVQLSVTALAPVPAERVLRQDAEHRVLVGDQHRTVAQNVPAAGDSEPGVVENKRSVFMLIGWILLILSVLYILFVLYQGGFKISAAGSRQAPTSRVTVDALTQLDT